MPEFDRHSDTKTRPSDRRARHPRTFDPEPYAREFEAIIDEITASPEVDSKRLDRILKRHPKDGVGLFSRAELIAGFRHFAPKRALPIDVSAWVGRLRLRPVRTLSGVTPVTVLTKPFPCPGKCIFCPNDVRMPKSYLADEPGAQRADDNAFDPYRQTWSRLETYRNIGHPVDKVELIVLGGTWSFHPESYQVWFVKRCFDALHDFGRGIDGRREAEAAQPVVRFGAQGERVVRGSHDGTEPNYNQVVCRLLFDQWGDSLLGAAETADWSELEAVQRANETAPCRSVGLALETRPDHISLEEVQRLRRLGATKVQIGIQSLSDRVLRANRRGHDVAATRRAMRLLRAAGFKIHAHWMPNLRGATPEGDVRDFARLFEDEDFRPDELKIYPCSLIESAELMTYYERGEWRPYSTQELVDILQACLSKTPPYCRVTRVIRDFSAHDIAAGNKIANLREVAERALQDNGGSCRDIRAREIRDTEFDPEKLEQSEIEYGTSLGREVFLQYVTPEDRLVAFLRLSLPSESCGPEEIRCSALIREVHVYGASLEIGRRESSAPQHLGFGRNLIERASDIAAASGFRDLAVISAVGTRGYYRALGFADGLLYQHRPVGQDDGSVSRQQVSARIRIRS